VRDGVISAPAGPTGAWAADMIKTSGYERTLLVWGIIQAAIGVVAALGLRVPPEDFWPAGRNPETVQLEMQSRRSYSPKEMLQSPIFYLLFIMMAMMSTSGLMVVSNVGPFANEYKVAQVLVFGMAALPLSLTLSRHKRTYSTVLWLGVGHIGRESTMALAFSLEAIAILVLFAFIDIRRCLSC
jgi:MFS transporter, OFA family, oxalate/formate antiporter